MRSSSTTPVSDDATMVDDPGLPQLNIADIPEANPLRTHQPSERTKLETSQTVAATPALRGRAVPKLFRRYRPLGRPSAGAATTLARDADYAVKFLNLTQDRLCFGTDIATPIKAAAGGPPNLRDSGKDPPIF